MTDYLDGSINQNLMAANMVQSSHEPINEQLVEQIDSYLEIYSVWLDQVLDALLLSPSSSDRFWDWFKEISDDFISVMDYGLSGFNKIAAQNNPPILMKPGECLARITQFSQKFRAGIEGDQVVTICQQYGIPHDIDAARNLLASEPKFGY